MQNQVISGRYKIFERPTVDLWNQLAVQSLYMKYLENLNSYTDRESIFFGVTKIGIFTVQRRAIQTRNFLSRGQPKAS
jgi:hypothetical protein